ncbi:MAG: hypothetical protein OXD29_13940 [Roseovarius sp.]|nr:hypothetical protein [Roseovarius sp.]
MNGGTLKSQLLELMKHVIIFIAFPEFGSAPKGAFDWCQNRWQVEPMLKRFKLIVQLGHFLKPGRDALRSCISIQIWQGSPHEI